MALDLATRIALREVFTGHSCCRCGQPAERYIRGSYRCGACALVKYVPHHGCTISLRDHHTHARRRGR